MFILAKEQPLLCFLTNDLLRILQEGSSLLNLMSNLFHTIYLYRYCDMINKWRGFRSLFAIPVLRSCSGRAQVVLYTQGLLLCACAVEPAAAEPDRTLSHRAVFESPRLPDPAAGGTVRPTHTYTCTLLQEKTSPRRQHHPQQVTIQAYRPLFYSTPVHCFQCKWPCFHLCQSV